MGSRIRRPREESGNRQIASTNVAGLTPGSGMDPFAGPTKRITVKECRADWPFSKATLCSLAEADNAIANGDHARARGLLFRIEEAPALSPAERLAAAQLAYRIAEIEEDALAREDALERMIASGAMSTSERLAGLRSLIALALKRGNEAAATSWLERLLADAPDDAQSLANLAALHARRGDHGRARSLMASAVETKRAKGESAPLSWTNYLATAPR